MYFVWGLLFELFRPSSAVVRQGENEILSVTRVTDVFLRLSSCRITEETRQRLISFASFALLLRLFLLTFVSRPLAPENATRKARGINAV